MTREQRIFTRLSFDHAVQWSDAVGEHGSAQLMDFSRGGMRLSIGRYYRPGPVLSFRFDEILYQGEPVEFQAIINWCRPVPMHPETFEAGVSIVHGEMKTLSLVSEVFYTALRSMPAQSC
jgi:hypothetical protein